MFKPVHPDYRKKVDDTGTIVFRKMAIKYFTHRILYSKNDYHSERVLGRCNIILAPSAVFMDSIELSKRLHELPKCYQLMFLDMIIAAGLLSAETIPKKKLMLTTNIELIEEIILDRKFELRALGGGTGGLCNKYAAVKILDTKQKENGENGQRKKS